MHRSHPHRFHENICDSYSSFKSNSILSSSTITELDDQGPNQAEDVHKVLNLSLIKQSQGQQVLASDRSYQPRARSASRTSEVNSKQRDYHTVSQGSRTISQNSKHKNMMTPAPSADPHSRKLATYLSQNGLSLDSFRIVGSLGAGAAGEVFRVSFTTEGSSNGSLTEVSKDKKEVFLAVKVIRKDTFCDFEVFHRIVERECENMIILEEIDGLPRFYEVAHLEQESFIFMELISGKKLSKIIKERKTLNPQIVLHICHQVAETMSKISSKQLMYSDLKPDNIIINLDGDLILLDFGSAKKCIVDWRGIKNSRLQHYLSEKEMEGIGTPEYMAPEYYNDTGLCLMSDVWSFGVLVYYLVCSNTPFADPNPVALRSKILQTNIQKLPEKFNDPAYKNIGQLVRNCLNKDPCARPDWDEILNYPALNAQTAEARKAGRKNLALLASETSKLSSKSDNESILLQEMAEKLKPILKVSPSKAA